MTIATGAEQAAHRLQFQWQNPSSVTAILMIVAGDIVGAALDQLSGPRITPVVFSFGWVSYAVNAFADAIGLSTLINPREASSAAGVSSILSKADNTLIDLQTGQSLQNRSYIINKIIRDWHYWKPTELKAEDLAESRKHGDSERGETDHYGVSVNTIRGHADVAEKTLADARLRTRSPRQLRISIYDVSPQSPPGFRYAYDYLWLNGVIVMLLQLGIAVIPCGLYGDWVPLFLTGTGNILAIATGMLPQFGQEKWGPCDHNRGIQAEDGSHAVALSVGPPRTAKDIIVIRNLTMKDSSRMHHLAGGLPFQLEPTSRHRLFPRHFHPSIPPPTLWPWTRVVTGILAACWIAQLVMVMGVQDNSWYIFGIGFLGMFQNAFVAGAPRGPASQGLRLKYVETVRGEGAAAMFRDGDEWRKDLGARVLAALSAPFGGEMKAASRVSRDSNGRSDEKAARGVA